MDLPPEKEHLLQIMHKVYKLLTQKSLCDLTVYVENACFHLHRCIFAAACPLLHYLILQGLENCQGNDLRLVLHDITPSGFKAVLGYMYTGRAPKKIPSSSVWDEFVAACKYLSLAYPVLQNGTISLCRPSEDVQFSLMPRSGDGAIEVYRMNKKSSVDDFEIEVEIPMEVIQQNNVSSEHEIFNREECLTQTESLESSFDEDVTGHDVESDTNLSKDASVTVLVEGAEQPLSVINSCNQPPRNIAVTELQIPEVKVERMKIQNTCDVEDATKLDFSTENSQVNALVSEIYSPKYTAPNQPQKRPRKIPAKLADSDFQPPKSVDQESAVPKKRRSYAKENGFRPWGCDRCGARFTRSYNLETHKKSFCGDTTNTTVQCLSCHREFSSKISFRSHARKKHLGETVEMVEVCRKKAKKLRKKPKDSKNRLFQCEICESWYQVRYRFDIHREKCNQRNRFKCSQCPRGYSNINDCEKHMWQSHGSRDDPQFEIKNVNPTLP